MRRQDPAIDASGPSLDPFDVHQPLICHIHTLVEGTVGCLGRRDERRTGLVAADGQPCLVWDRCREIL